MARADWLAWEAAFDEEIGQRLSGRTRNVLIRNGWRVTSPGSYADALRRTPDAALLTWHGVGPMTLAELRRVLPYAPPALSRHPWWLVD